MTKHGFLSALGVVAGAGVLPIVGCSGSDEPGTENTSPAPDGMTTMVWAAADSPVSLDEDFVVAAGERLRIMPGVRVELGPGVHLIVDGELEARGTESALIEFVGSAGTETDQRWASVVFNDGSIDAVFENVDEYRSGSIVEFVRLSGAEYALKLHGAAPYIHASIFQGNEAPQVTHNKGGAALYMDGGSMPRVRDNQFIDNKANVFGFGGAVYVELSHPILQDNLFRGNWSSYGGALSTDNMASPIVGNTFEENESLSEGGALCLVSSPAPVMNNLIQRNHAKKDGGGFHVCVTCDPHATPSVTDNTIIDNVSDTHDPQHGAAGMGAAFLRLMQNNNIHGNLRAGEKSDFGWFHPLEDGFPEWVYHRSIANNYWGTTDEAELDATIFDASDGYDKLGTVDYLPVLDAAGTPIARALIGTRRIRYMDGDDKVEVYVSLYNPGAEGTFTVKIEHTGLDGMTTVYDGDLGVPVLDQREDGQRLVLGENTAQFAIIEQGTYDGTSVGEGKWRATLSQDGEVVGVPSEARYLLGYPDAVDAQ